MANSTRTQFSLQSPFEQKTAYIDLYVAYDIVNHRFLIQIVYNTAQYSKFYRVIQSLLSNRRLCMELNNVRNRWIKQNNGLPQDNVLAPTLFNIYTNEQPIHNGNRSFIYADDICITIQYQSFRQAEERIEVALYNLTTYYKMNSLRENPEEKNKSQE